MPHTLETRKRAYEKIKVRKQNWFVNNGPCVKCGSFEDLELDHINPNTKESHCVWSWSEERRNKELAKCQCLCNSCHRIKSNLECSVKFTGRVNLKLRNLSLYMESEVIRMHTKEGMSYRKLAEYFGVNRGTIQEAIKRFHTSFQR